MTRRTGTPMPDSGTDHRYASHLYADFMAYDMPEQIPMAGYSHVSKPDNNHHDYGDVKYARPRRGSSASRKLDRQKSHEAQRWAEVWYDFTQTTTLHGVCRITEPTPFPIRKVLWVLIVMCGISLFTYQLVASIMLYFSRPVTVNIRINYNQSISFPAITVCNLNAFRSTRAAALGFYDTLYNAYVHDTKLTLNNTGPGGSDLDLQLVYETLAHSKEDLIVNCEWQNRACATGDFQDVMTNHGLCFTFNGGNITGKDRAIYEATRTGAGSGVKLRMNVEQYEYMPGPNSGAGVKILVHDQKDVPMVKEMGQVVPPGSNGLVGIQITKVTNLQPPYGKCHDDLEMTYFQFYTHATCQMDCEARYLVRYCGCRMHFMPELTPGYPKVCTLGIFLSCVHKAIARLNRMRDEVCPCPVPCTRDIFESVISYGLISRFDTEQILYQHRGGHLRHSFARAREVSQRVDKNIQQFDHDLVDTMVFGQDYIRDELDKLARLVNESLDEFQSALNKITTRMRFHGDYTLRAFQDVLEYGFLQQFSMITRSIERFLNSYSSVFKDYDGLLDEQNTTGTIDPSTLHDLQMDAAGSFKNVVRDADHIIAFLRDLNESLQTGQILRNMPAYRDILSTTFISIVDEDLDNTLIPWFLLDKFGHGTIGEKVVRIAMLVMNKLRSFFHGHDSSGMHATIFGNYSGTKHKVEVACSFLTHFNKHLSVQITESRVYVEDRRNQYFLGMALLHEVSGNLNVTLRQTIQPKTMQILERLDEVQLLLNLSKNYLADKTLNKSDLATVATSDDFATTLEMVQNLGYDVVDGSRTLQRDYRKYREMYEGRWYMVSQNNVTDTFYQQLITLRPSLISNQTKLDELAEDIYVNISSPADMQAFRDFITNGLSSDGPSSELEDMELIMRRLFFQMDLEKSTRAEWRRFLENLRKWKTSLHEFLKGNKLDADFFRENFLDIEVFMKELYYEEIEQRVAYDLISLFSDIGGSLGLCVGASVITLIEMMDAIAHNVAKVHFT